MYANLKSFWGFWLILRIISRRIDESTYCQMKGNPADSRMRAAARKRGIEITSISRPIRPSDFTEFDLILAMDKQNRGHVHAQHIIFIILFVLFRYYELVFYY